jgi:hypothetical protein
MSGGRVARSYLVVTAMSGCIAACSSLLDIPDDPYLVEPTDPTIQEALPPSVQTGMEQQPSESGAESSGGSDVDVTDVQGAPPAQMMTANDVDTPLTTADAGIDTPPDAAPPGPCPAGATLGPSDRCYATIATALTWDAARSQCQSFGAGWDLAAIHDAATNELVTALMTEEAWLGGSDAAFEDNWLWVSDNQPFWSGTGATGAAVDGAYENWNSDEPNGGGPSDCLRLVAGIGTWADLQCTFERPSVCEGPAR